MSASLIRSLALIGTGLLVGCVSGIIGDPGGANGGGGGIANGAAVGQCTTADAQNVHSTAARVRRLTGAEYDATIQALIGDTSHPSTAFPADDKVNGYSNNADALVVTPLLAEALGDTAAKLAKQAVANNLSSIVPCDPAAAGEDACARQFIQTFGKKAFRRPLADDEVETAFKVYQAGRDGATFNDGVELALEYFFQAPALLYKSELGDGTTRDDGSTTLTGQEIAASISFLVTGAPPDDELVAAAEAGDLANADAREKHARRLLSTPAARAQVANFVFEWLGLDNLDSAVKDAQTYPAFNDALRQSMKAETAAYVADVVFDGEGTLKSLLSASYTYADQNLAQLYGLGTAGALAKVTLDPATRAGILTQASVLTTYSQAAQDSPVRRGKFVRVRLLCQDIPPPPRDLVIVPPPPSTTNTTRERFAAHANSPTCQTCHSKMDPIGFGFSNYDGIGQFRTTENGFPIDASGELTGTTDADGPFNGVVELASRLASSADVRACFARNWLRYSMARSDKPQDACTIQNDFGAFKSGQGTIRDLVISMVRANEFVVRAPVAP